MAVSKDDTGYILTVEGDGSPGRETSPQGQARRFPGPLLEPRDRSAGEWSACSAARSSRSMKRSTSSRTIPWSASGVRREWSADCSLRSTTEDRFSGR